MWNGMFAPIKKHRDYAHANFWAHIMDNGGSYEVDPIPIRLKYRPLDARLHNPSDRYYFVDIDLAHGQPIYEFVIHSEPDLSSPDENRISNEFNALCANPVVGGRDWWEYIDPDHEETLRNPRFRARLAADDDPRMGPPRQWEQPRELFWGTQGS